MLVEDRRGKILVVLIAVVEREAYKIPGGEFRERFGQVFKMNGLKTTLASDDDCCV